MYFTGFVGDKAIGRMFRFFPVLGVYSKKFLVTGILTNFQLVLLLFLNVFFLLPILL